MLLTVTWISSGAVAAAAALTTPGSRVAEPRMPEMHVFVHTRAQLPHSGFNKSVRVGGIFSSTAMVGGGTCFYYLGVISNLAFFTRP